MAREPGEWLDVTIRNTVAGMIFCPHETPFASVLCPGGKYNNNNLNGCLDCESDVDSSAGATECNLCTPGNYWDGEGCEKCPYWAASGPKGTTIRTIIISEGFYRFSVDDVRVYECMPGMCMGSWARNLGPVWP